MTTVCIGPEMRPDEQGRLRISLAGAPAEQAWPYPCAPAASPLRIDPALGLWAPPPPRLAVVTASGSSGTVNSVVPSAFTIVETAAITITNPSACYPATVLQFVHVDVDLNLPPNGDATAAARVDTNEFLRVTNAAPAGGTNMQNHWEFVEPSFQVAVIPAGGSANFSHPIELGGGTGGARWTRAAWTIKAVVLAGLT
ncbi:hypothetical protein [Thermomonospora cellulosilytica]|uniref:Uncharacterized protein n=1 Tax=Thermomonospora cellulosilytica TaxID=1411118 RepID=A0A7W3N1S0_9ACTN|nr:hypothetical protein [Thermomonospora cellulosilytica]MBA9005907.1 hypothetical protein [Thermomonospora cellulosilytica]